MTRRVRASAATTKRRPKPEPVATFTPNPLAWAEALRLAGGDASRLKALDESTVLVANTPLRT